MAKAAAASMNEALYADGAKPMASAMLAPPAPRFEDVVHNVMKTARSQKGHQLVSDAINRLVSSERYDAENALAKYMDRDRRDKLLCDLILVRHASMMVNNPRSPIIIGSTTMAAIMSVLDEHGYTAFGMAGSGDKAEGREKF